MLEYLYSSFGCFLVSRVDACFQIYWIKRGALWILREGADENLIFFLRSEDCLSLLSLGFPFQFPSYCDTNQAPYQIPQNTNSQGTPNSTSARNYLVIHSVGPLAPHLSFYNLLKYFSGHNTGYSVADQYG